MKMFSISLVGRTKLVHPISDDATTNPLSRFGGEVDLLLEVDDLAFGGDVFDQSVDLHEEGKGIEPLGTLAR
jgi:hypothetical protein